MTYWPVYKIMNLRKLLSPVYTTKLSDAYHITLSKTVEEYEAPHPNILTKYPGPKAIQFKSSLNSISGISNSTEIIDYNKSFGNYFLDIDGNTILDMYQDEGRNVLGYNSRKLSREAKLQKYKKFMYQNTLLDVMPPEEYPKLISNLITKIAPPNLNEILFTSENKSSANENAIKLAFLNKFYEMKGTNEHTVEEENSVMRSESPGAPDYTIISFKGSHHGTSFELRRWPQVTFPNIRYPYEEFENENLLEEQRCLLETEKLIKESNNVAGLIVAPLQPGVYYASSQFYKDLIDICYDNNISFICDETSTSGFVDGRAFMHKRWVSEKPVHLVTFGGRMQAHGVIYQNQFRPSYRHQIESKGDPGKLLQLNHIIEEVNKGWLDSHSAQFLQGIKAELYDLQKRWSVKIKNIRGIGKIFAFDVEDRVVRDEIVHDSRSNGFKVGKYGETSIVFTPSILFTEVHFAQYKKFLLGYYPHSANVYQNRI